jgi:hypothetical protein
LFSNFDYTCRRSPAQVDTVERNNFVLQEEKLRALSQRDEFARQLGKDPAKLFPPGGNLVLPGEQAMKYAQVLEKRMKVGEIPRLCSFHLDQLVLLEYFK